MGGGRRETIDDVTERANVRNETKILQITQPCGMDTRIAQIPRQASPRGSGDLSSRCKRKAVRETWTCPWATPVTVAGHAYRCVLVVYTCIHVYVCIKMFAREQQQRLLHSPNCGRYAFALSVRSRVSIWVLAYSRVILSIRDSGEFPGVPPRQGGRLVGEMSL